MSVRLSHHPTAQLLGQRLGHFGKRMLGGMLDWIIPVPRAIAVDAVRDVRRVVLVRPNFRIGNTLMTTPLVLALRERFPNAQIDYLGGDTTVSLLQHLPLDHVYAVSRRFILRPWQFVALFLHLRQQHYDVAVEGGLGSFSGGLYVYLLSARYRIGYSGRADRFLNVRLPPVTVPHAYDGAVVLAKALGVNCSEHPIYRVGPVEHATAFELLRQLDLTRETAICPFAAIFVGGHQDKRLAPESWVQLARDLSTAGGRLLVFLGPEEMALEPRFRRELPAAAHVLPPQPLRIFAALLAAARLIVTTDSGPMHLAAALRLPMVALLQAQASLHYRPRGPQDRALVQPTVREAVAAILAHPAWNEIVQPAKRSDSV